MIIGKKMRYILGADIGGSHITAAVVDMQHRSLIPSSFFRMPIDSTGSVESIIKQWSDTIMASIDIAEKGVEGISIAMPGPFDYERGISFMKEQGKYEKLYGINVKKALAVALDRSSRDLIFDNDAACLLKGELFAGAGISVSSAFGVTLGTGLGSAVSIEGKVRDAALWNSPYKESIAEEYLSTRWFLKRYYEFSGKHVQNVKQLCGSGKQVIVQGLFEEFGDNLKTFLNVQIETFHPEMVIVGGNIAQAYELFSPRLDVLKVPVKKAILGEKAALLGAASNFTEYSVLSKNNI